MCGDRFPRPLSYGAVLSFDIATGPRLPRPDEREDLASLLVVDRREQLRRPPVHGDTLLWIVRVPVVDGSDRSVDVIENLGDCETWNPCNTVMLDSPTSSGAIRP